MARRGRGSSARTKPTPEGREAAVEAAANPVDPGDEPGARTIGAMALKRWVARGPGRDAVDDGGEGLRTYGPFDEDDMPDESTVADRVDFGAVRVPVPHGGEVAVEPEDGRLQAVHVMLPAGRLSVSALAAPRTERLWPDLAAEIDESLREGGATVRSFTGEWGRELHARTGDASSLFVGVDGPRWMLYGVATGPTSAAADLDAALRAMLRGTVVVRGRSPYPVRTVLPLTVPDELPRPGIAPDRVPVPRMPVERTSPPARPAATVDAPVIDAPTTITAVSGVHTVPHGIPHAVPDEDAGRAAYRSEPAAQTGPAADHPHDPEPEAGSDAETGVARTASRGLFRRKPPERPSQRPQQRPQQRRVADLLAQAERDRRAAARGGTPSRPERPAPRPDEATDSPAPDTRRERPVPYERSVADGHPPTHDAVDGTRTNGSRTDGSRTNGYIPRELSHHPRPTNGAAADAPYRDVAGGHVPSPYARSPYDSSATNGSGFVTSDGAVGYDAPAADTHAAGYTNDSWLDDTMVNGSYRGGATVDGQARDTDRVTGTRGPDSFDVEPSAPAWRASGDPGYPPFGGPGADLSTGADGGEVGRIEATVWASLGASLGLGGADPSTGLPADGSDDWTLPLPVVRPAPQPVHPEPEPVRPPAYPGTHRAEGHRAEGHSAEGHHADAHYAAAHHTDAPYADAPYAEGHHGGGHRAEARRAEAHHADAPYAEVHHGGGHQAEARRADAPYADAHYAEARPAEARTDAPRGRRARREAGERAAEDRWAPNRLTPDRWTPDRWTPDRSTPDRSTPQPQDADRWTPDRAAPGAHSTDRPRHTRGHHEPEPPLDEYSRRSARRRSRHTEERDDVASDLGRHVGGHADRARHRRPGD